MATGCRRRLRRPSSASDSSAAACCPLSWNVLPVREIAGNIMKPYILDDASTLEYLRLDLMSKILDPWTREYFTALGVGEGWQCLELGSGNGSIAEWLSQTVSPSGNVTAIDINPVLLELIPHKTSRYGRWIYALHRGSCQR